MPRPDVIVVGAGPTGAFTALLLSRAGVRVQLLDRAEFPRPKLCGDSVNPGAMGILERHGLAERVRPKALPVFGMLLSGSGITLCGAYPTGASGCSIQRQEFDTLLVEAAVRAGAYLETGTRVMAPLLESDTGRQVTGVLTQTASGSPSERRTRMVIAADGRRSAIAFALGLARHPTRPRRWALGTYFEQVDGLTGYGEMHVRPGHYLGVAPVPEGLANVCLVLPERKARAVARDGAARVIEEVLRQDWLLADRFRQARRVAPVTVLGPLAVDATSRQVEGLLVAGDASGFVDPMTGDGLRLALRGAELAASAALEFLQGRAQPASYLRSWHARELGTKLRVNRLLRTLVAVPGGVRGASMFARLWPDSFGHLIRYAGDVQTNST